MVVDIPILDGKPGHKQEGIRNYKTFFHEDHSFPEAENNSKEDKTRQDKVTNLFAMRDGCAEWLFYQYMMWFGMIDYIHKNAVMCHVRSRYDQNITQSTVQQLLVT